MAITIEDDLQSVLEMLWIREGWQLEPAGDELPPVLVDTPAPLGRAQRSAAPISEWQDAWPQVWASVLQHAGTVRDPDMFDRLHATENGSEERARLLRDLIGPSWRDEVSDEAITDETQHWMRSQFERRVARPAVALEERPERLALEPLIGAWRRGLTKIVEIPCRGSFTRRIGDHAILVTAETRADPVRYDAALKQFR